MWVCTRVLQKFIPLGMCSYTSWATLISLASKCPNERGKRNGVRSSAVWVAVEKHSPSWCQQLRETSPKAVLSPLQSNHTGLCCPITPSTLLPLCLCPVVLLAWSLLPGESQGSCPSLFLCSHTSLPERASGHLHLSGPEPLSSPSPTYPAPLFLIAISTSTFTNVFIFLLSIFTS